MPSRVNPLDLPDDYFRIRLISTILETCGMFFNKGAAGRKLDYFLSFFQYYIYTKDPLPMDIEFLVQDIFSLTRPQWKLASNLEEATKVFQLAVLQDQKTSGLEKGAEQDDRTSGVSSDDDNVDDLQLGDHEDDDDDGSEDAEVEVCPCTPTLYIITQTNRVRIGQDNEQNPSYSDGDSEEAEIVVTRQEEEIDPEDEADFEREYAKMMAESLESRKSERKQQFDLPLPVRPKARDHPAGTEPGEGTSDSLGGTMAFSLLTKRGNRQQVCSLSSIHICVHSWLTPYQTRTVALPSDSNFAVAMKTQQQAEREEQQRIKNLVLNYDLRENEDADGEPRLAPLNINTNIHKPCLGTDKSASHYHNRLDNRSVKERGGQRVRKLQLSDVDWYGKSQKHKSSPVSTPEKALHTQSNSRVSGRCRQPLDDQRPKHG